MSAKNLILRTKTDSTNFFFPNALETQVIMVCKDRKRESSLNSEGFKEIRVRNVRGNLKIMIYEEKN